MINGKDIRVFTYFQSCGESPYLHTMTITHIPTGQFVEGTGHSTYQLRRDLTKQLEKKLNE